MTLSLSPAVQRLIDDRVKSGRYSSAEDVVAAAMVSLEQQEDVANLTPEEFAKAFPGLHEKLEEGLAAAREGRVSDGEEFFAELEREEADDAGRKSA